MPQPSADALDTAAEHIGVYAIEHIPSGRRYIGSSRDIDARWADHRRRLRTGNHRTEALQELWKTDGESAFRHIVLELCETAQLGEREQYWLDHASDPLNAYEASPYHGGGGPKIINIGAATEHVLATAEAFTQVNGFITAEVDGCPNKEQLISRRLQAWDMRVDGHSYREIAKASGVSLPTAYDDVQIAASYIDDVRKQKAERVLDFEDARCDKAQKALLPKVLKGEPRAVMAYVRVSEHRARLLGLYAPEKVQHEGILLNAQVLAGSRSSLDEKLEQLRQRMGGSVVDVTLAPAQIGPISPNSTST